ncbi:DUF4148 domain-containing protein [Burkholderia ubonensis]|uniref:DUF4148 domain-containing protein n=1 Tax=Burkholderia ubonensis TaxID=101571 RepID=A0A1R1J7L5_9BURK|nr:DUF4148 domain-containing protein [Burkholderia ubonensis]OMG71290.1 hypothetical protein BW685_23075 [Burkholderia ubonensis]
MNIRTAVAMVVAATAATSAFADGGHGYPGAYAASSTASSASSTRGGAAVAPAGSSGNSAPSGTTREEVRQELIRAYHDGLLPTSNHDYPPSPETIARNKALHSLREPVWAAQH